MADDYVLGTHDDEIARLGLQHEVWKAAALAAWQRAGISVGATVIDLGSGPGFAAVDLADVDGPTGRVHALDRSQRFLDLVPRRPQITTHICDLDRDALPVGGVDAVWVRWLFCFLAKPRELLARVAGALRPGGVFVAHEYYDYRTWRSAPRSAEIEEFVAAVMASWRSQGGEPDIAMSMVPWLSELGFEVIATRPVVDVVPPGDPKWEWVAKFGDVGLSRLVDLGRVTADRARQIRAAWADLRARPESRMVTPSVLEIVARRR